MAGGNVAKTCKRKASHKQINLDISIYKLVELSARNSRKFILDTLPVFDY
jgi:hypothetical protein